LLAAGIILFPACAGADYVMPGVRPGSSAALKRQFQGMLRSPLRSPLGAFKGPYYGTKGIADFSSGEKAITWFQQSVLKKLKIYLDLEETFDDNIFRTSEDKEADLITRVSTGFRYGFNPSIFAKQKVVSAGFKFDIGFKLRWILYRKNSQLNQTADLNNLLFGKNKKSGKKSGSGGLGGLGGFGSGGLAGGGITGGLVSPDIDINLEPARRFQVRYKGSSKLNNLIDIDPTANKKKNRDKKRWIDSWTNRYALQYTFGPDPTQFVLNYSRTDRMYQDEDGWRQQNTNTDKVAGRMFLGRPEAKKRFFIGADYAAKKHPKNKTRKTQKDGNVFFGVQGRFSPRISGTLDAGYGAAGIGSGLDKVELITPVYRMRLTYQMHPRFGILLGIRRFVADDRDYDEADTGADDSTGFLSRDKKLTDNVSLGFKYIHPLSARRDFGIKAGATLKRTEYTAGDDDLRYDFKLSPQYRLNDRTRLIFEYVHERRLSSPGIEGYINNRFSAKLKWEF